MRERENLRWVLCCCLLSIYLSIYLSIIYLSVFSHYINNTRTRAYGTTIYMVTSIHVLCERPPAGRRRSASGPSCVCW